MTTAKIILNNIELKILGGGTEEEKAQKKKEIAKKMGIKPQSIDTILRNLKNENTITIRTLEKLAAAADLKNYKELL